MDGVATANSLYLAALALETKRNAGSVPLCIPTMVRGQKNEK